MSDPDFAKIKQLFAELSDLDAAVQREQIAKLSAAGELNETQVELLQSMLAADKQPDMPTQVQSVPDDLLDEIDAFHTPQPGHQLGPYSLIKKIGSGGMGQVFLAERNDGQFEQQVAIKVSHAHLDEALLKRFETERQILSDLNHPNIARLLDGGTGPQGQPYLVMEFLDGHSIDKFCVNNKPDLKVRIELILQACDAISMAHKNLILHRDLKPDNIMVTQSGQVKVVDFGIAKLLEPIDAQAELTATQVMTRYYASPEQIKGQHVSTQSDLFSLAIIAYELITGCHPFIKNNTDTSQHKRESNVLSGEIMPIANRHQIDKPLFPELTQIPNNRIQGDLENILRKALYNDLNQRYPSVDAFAQDLKNFLANKPVTARKPTLFYQIKKLIQRQKIAAAAIFLTVIALVTATVYSLHKAEEALQQKQLADQQRKLAEIESEKAAQIADFVKNMLQKAKPQSSEKQLTAQDLLFQGFTDANDSEFIHQETKFELLALIHQGLKSLGKYQESLELIDQHYAECISQVSNHHPSCQALLNVKAQIQTTLRQDQQALETIKMAEEINLSRNTFDRNELFDFYAIKNSALLHLDQIDESRELQLHMFEMETAAADTDIQRLVQILHNLSLSHIIHDEFEQARNYMDQIPGYLEDYDEQELPMWLGAHYGLEAYYYSSQNDARKSYEFRKKRVELMEASFEVLPEKFGLYLRNAGDMALRSGLPNEALQYYQRALKFYQDEVSGSENDQYTLLVKMTLHQLMENNLETAKQLYSQTSVFEPSAKTASKTNQKLAVQIELFFNMLENKVTAEMINNACQLQDEKNKLIHYYCHIITIQHAFNQNDFNTAQQTLTTLKELSQQTPNDYLTFKQKIAELDSLISLSFDQKSKAIPED